MDIALLRSAEQVPPAAALPGGCLYELKWDGYRVAIVRNRNGAKLWSRQGRDLSAAFPDLVAAAEFHLEPGTVVDGEAVVWHDGRLSFDLLQARMARRHGPAILKAVRENPASYVAFDLIALNGNDLRSQPLHRRRRQLERIAGKWSPPLELSPATRDRDEAMGWFEDYRVAGIEGLVAKAADGRYSPGARDWVKIKNRQTTEVIVGAVTGTLAKPTALIAGRVDHGRLIIVGRSTALTEAQSAQLGDELVAAGHDHPWPHEIFSGVFGSNRRVAIARTDPTLVVEVAADSAIQAGRFRHPVRYLRARPDLHPADLAAL